MLTPGIGPATEGLSGFELFFTSHAVTRTAAVIRRHAFSDLYIAHQARLPSKAQARATPCIGTSIPEAQVSVRPGCLTSASVEGLPCGEVEYTRAVTRVQPGPGSRA